MRDRAWRRYIEERIVIRRIRTAINSCSYWRFFQDVNGYGHNPARVKDFIGTKDAHRFKTHVTTIYDSRYKSKYSPNRGFDHDRDMNINDRTREASKKEFCRILRENGIK